MKYLSVCSGIEAATVAWHGLGWEPVAFAEIEPFPSAVLAHHYPDVPNLGDMTTFKEWQVDAFDVLVGGTPCQAFSVAGLRQSLDDARGNLSLIFCEMADHFDPPYILWENVPGVLNTKDNAFGCFLAGLAGEDVPLVAPGGKWTNAGFVLGPKRNVAWRVLDAQYFGLAQRRRRVFVVACPRDGADPCEILFEREGVQRNSPPSREKGEGASATLESRSRGGGFPGTDGACGGHVVPVCGGGPESGQIAGTVSRKWSKGSGGPAGDECYNMVACITGPITHALKADGFDGSEDGTGRGMPIVFHPTQDPIRSEDGSCHALGCGSKGGTATHAVAFREIAPTLPAQAGGASSQDMELHTCAGSHMQVRRLTPVECERLQGFPDGYTAIPWRNKPASECPDGPRYKALGNSMAVPCMRWIGWRIGLTKRNP